jgi:hypothetical protein
MSVASAAEIWRRVAFLEGQTATVYTHEEKSTVALYDYYQQFITSYNANAYIGLRQLSVIKAQVGKYIVFEGGGSIQFGTAGTSSGGRSKPNRYLHNSECALWPDAVTLRTGLLSSVPLTEGTVVIDESTARGYGGPFHSQWQRAMDPENRSGWLAMFFAWWEHPENRKTVQNPRHFHLTDIENRIMERYALDLEQVNWRREKIATDCEGDVRRFEQEHPGNPEEAFLTSGRAVFDLGQLAIMPVVDQWETGTIEEREIGPRKILQFIPRMDGHGIIQILRKPVPNHRYVIGVDPAKGIDISRAGATEDPDYSVAQVIDRVTGVQVAVIRVRMEPAPFAEWVRTLHRFYNNAFLVPESTGMGTAVIQELIRPDPRDGSHIEQKHIFLRNREPHDRRPALLQHFGFETSSVTRPHLISALETAIREQSINITHARTLQECRMFVTHSDGKKRAQTGEHDDCVMALALSVMGLRAAPDEPLKAPPRFVGEDDDDDNPQRKRKSAWAFATR